MNWRIVAPLASLAVVACGARGTDTPASDGLTGPSGDGSGAPSAMGDDSGGVSVTGDDSRSSPATGDDGGPAVGPQGEGSDASTDSVDASPGAASGPDATAELDASEPAEAAEGTPSDGGCSGASPEPLVGWASVAGLNVTTTTGGAGGATVKVSTLADLNSNASGTTAISDGSDGNLDITHASDFITISWTKFHYSGRRTDPAGAAGGHQFSNLIGHSDSNASEDTGHLTVTFHHDWWADNVVERMPRVRFGKVHLFDNLYTAAGNDYCVGVGVNANIRDENDVFVGVKNPIDSTDYSNGASIIQSSGDLFQTTTGTTQDIGGAAFTPPYVYTLDPASGVEASVKNGAGPQ